MGKEKKLINFMVTGSETCKVTTKNANIVAIDDTPCDFSAESLTPREYQMSLEGKTFFGEVVSIKQNRCTVRINSNTYHFCIDTESGYERKKQHGDTQQDNNTIIKAPLPGVVCDILVNEGIKVNTGDPLLTLEAMKMLNEICSPITGVVTKISVKENQTVSSDQILIELKKEDTLP